MSATAAHRRSPAPPVDHRPAPAKYRRHGPGRDAWFAFLLPVISLVGLAVIEGPGYLLRASEHWFVMLCGMAAFSGLMYVCHFRTYEVSPWGITIRHFGMRRFIPWTRVAWISGPMSHNGLITWHEIYDDQDRLLFRLQSSVARHKRLVLTIHEQIARHA